MLCMYCMQDSMYVHDALAVHTIKQHTYSHSYSATHPPLARTHLGTRGGTESTASALARRSKQTEESTVVSAAAMAPPSPAAAAAPASPAVPQGSKVELALAAAKDAAAALRRKGGAGSMGSGAAQYKQMFPLKLFHALESGAFADVIDWTEDGLSIVVKDTKMLEDRFLPTIWGRECGCSDRDVLPSHSRNLLSSRAPLLPCMPPQTPKCRRSIAS